MEHSQTQGTEVAATTAAKWDAICAIRLGMHPSAVWADWFEMEAEEV